jgi:hypothetical protein
VEDDMERGQPRDLRKRQVLALVREDCLLTIGFMYQRATRQPISPLHVSRAVCLKMTESS